MATKFYTVTSAEIFSTRSKVVLSEVKSGKHAPTILVEQTGTEIRNAVGLLEHESKQEAIEYRDRMEANIKALKGRERIIFDSVLSHFSQSSLESALDAAWQGGLSFQYNYR